MKDEKKNSKIASFSMTLGLVLLLCAILFSAVFFSDNLSIAGDDDVLAPRYIIHGIQPLSMLWSDELPYAIDSEMDLFVGIQPLNMLWTDELPYTEGTLMEWDAATGFDATISFYQLLYVVFDREEGFLTSVYTTDEQRTFAWTFSEARGSDGHPHPDEGAYWIEDHLDDWGYEYVYSHDD